jgi:hypothetical protein
MATSTHAAIAVSDARIAVASTRGDNEELNVLLSLRERDAVLELASRGA